MAHVTERLKALRERAGLSMSYVARECGYKGSSSIQHYEDGNLYKKDYLPAHLVSSLADVLVGLGTPPITREEVLSLGFDVSEVGQNEISMPGGVTIRELDVRGDGGGGINHAPPEAEKVSDNWVIPRRILQGHTTAPPSGLRIITIRGDSMAPDFLPGERIMVDTDDRKPSPPGVFVLWDGIGLVVKRLELVPNSDPLTLRLISRNDQYAVYEREADQVQINGRVIGKWLWT